MADCYENGSMVASAYQGAREHLEQQRYRWLVTGVAGFIGSNLLETLLQLGQDVVGLDNFLTGYSHNLEQVRHVVGAQAWSRFQFIKGDIRDLAVCQRACAGADFVLHQAAVGSVGRSIEDPLLSNDINVGGFLNVLVAARDARVRRMVYAASSASYGDHPALPKLEAAIGNPLSPYALTKCINEQYAAVFQRCYGCETIGLRYFNIFGPRQDPDGAYAAVIPQWIAALIGNRQLTIHGDGESSRDFCFIGNAVQANLLAALSTDSQAINQVYNVAVNGRTSLNELYLMLHGMLVEHFPHLHDYQPHYGAFRPGDIRHSQADISKAGKLLGFAPTHDLPRGLKQALPWYVARMRGTA
ncbi:SDR family oxidoreductase [Oxalobacteraceae bacterium]|nr:SDR family oxidoreductase [Oxalobacteraceae bacterium]